ncbi:cullin, ubiquitin ligase activity protein [Scheffersomyces xylosifermentans]|uniref:cullin, ubiquitin ligase activity protein n=1 Tax=Scheffersomyces xylosifermentans TaxID=1304137 RepID=UPI00315C9BCA
MSSVSSILDFGKSNSGLRGEGTPSHLSPSLHRSTDSLETSSTTTSHKRSKPNVDIHAKEFVLDQLNRTKKSAEEVIDLVLAGKQLTRSYNAYYQEVEAICRFKHAEQSKLAALLYEKLDSHYIEVKESTIKLVEYQIDTSPIQAQDEDMETETNHDLHEDKPPKNILEWSVRFLSIFSTWQAKLRLLGKLFLYLDRGYLLPHSSKKTIMEYGLTLYVSDILANKGKENKIAQEVLKRYLLLLRRDRIQFEVYTDVSEEFTRTLLRLNFKDNITLHKIILDDIANHYSQLRAQWSQEDNYFARICTRITNEIEFFDKCAHTRKFLRELLLKIRYVTIFDDFDSFLEGNFASLIQSNDSQNSKQLLSRLYTLCQSSSDDYTLETIPMLLFHWGSIIERSVENTIQACKSSGENVLLKLNEIATKYAAIAKENFKDDEVFQFESRSSFHKALNERSNNSYVVFQLCRFCDAYFKGRGNINMPFEEFQNTVLVVFKALSNKRDFTELYQKDLSKRLLISRTTDFSKEKDLADSLLDIIGENEDNVGLQVMFKDLVQSREVYSSLLSSSPVEFTPLILEKNHWPDIPKQDTEVILPKELTEIIDQFTGKYEAMGERFKSQKLDWSNYALHQLSINAEFESGSKELVVNLLQAVIILLFNDRESYSFDEIQKATKIGSKLLRRILSSLSSEKYSILLRTRDDNAIYTFNNKFTDRSNRIKIPIPKDKDIAKVAIAVSEQETNRVIEHNRQEEFKSIIVKVMKEFKEMSVTELLNKCIEKLEKRSPVVIQELKRNLDDLVENEYVRRVNSERLAYIP